MRSKAHFLTITVLSLLVSSAFGQTQSSISLSGPGSASSSSSSTSSSSQGTSQTATGMQTSTPGPSTGATPAAARPPEVTLPSSTLSLQPFTTIALCAPINLLIVPNSTANGYAFTVTAEQGVLSNIIAEVGPSGVLAITATGPFTTNQTVQLTASLPPDALNSIIHSGPSKKIFPSSINYNFPFFYWYFFFLGLFPWPFPSGALSISSSYFSSSLMTLNNRMKILLIILSHYFYSTPQVLQFM